MTTQFYDQDNIRNLCTTFLEALRHIEHLHHEWNITPTEIAIAYLMAGEYHLKVGHEHWFLTGDELDQFRREARTLALDLYNKAIGDQEQGIRND